LYVAKNVHFQKIVNIFYLSLLINSIMALLLW
jgi:hypothetical protein